MDKTPTKLDDFPGLINWFRQNQFEAVHRSPAERFVWKTCLALTSPGALLIRQWSDAFVELIDDGDDPQDDLMEAKAIIDECGTGLIDLLADLGGLANRTNQSKTFIHAMTMGADNTSLAAFRFMSAWTALNSGDLERCVTDCDKIEEPFSSVCAIQGQALLELGRVREAIESLNLAVRLDPKELIAWFQLAKAYHVLDQHRSAWMALSQCRKLSPDNPEVALFCAMVALSDDSDTQVTEAFELLVSHLPDLRGMADVSLRLVALTIRMRDKEKFSDIVEGSDWDALRNDDAFIKQIPKILKDLEAIGWMDAARDLLVAITKNIDKTG